MFFEVRWFEQIAAAKTIEQYIDVYGINDVILDLYKQKQQKLSLLIKYIETKRESLYNIANDITDSLSSDYETDFITEKIAMEVILKVSIDKNLSISEFIAYRDLIKKMYDNKSK